MTTPTSESSKMTCCFIEIGMARLPLFLTEEGAKDLLWALCHPGRIKIEFLSNEMVTHSVIISVGVTLSSQDKPPS